MDDPIVFPKKKQDPPKDAPPYLASVRTECSGMDCGTFEVDMSSETVFCKKCKETKSPLWVLNKLATSETRWHRTMKLYRITTKRLEEKKRTKCEHCGKMATVNVKPARIYDTE